MKSKEWKIHVQAVTDPGCERNINEDNFSINGEVQYRKDISHFTFSSEAYLGNENSFYLVADGMGGQEAGDVASMLLTEAASEYSGMLKQCDVQAYEECVVAINTMLESARKKISDAFDNIEQISGTTATVILIGKERAHLTNIGDSPAYCFRKSKMIELYDDQSQTGVMVKSNLMTPEEAALSHKRHTLTAYVGTGNCDIKTCAHHNNFKIKKGDFLLLASDGLTEELSKKEIIDVFKKSKREQVVDELFNSVMKAGATDNITIIGINIEG